MTSLLPAVNFWNILHKYCTYIKRNILLQRIHIRLHCYDDKCMEHLQESHNFNSKIEESFIWQSDSFVPE